MTPNVIIYYVVRYTIATLLLKNDGISKPKMHRNTIGMAATLATKLNYPLPHNKPT